jgi:polysaccharide deacetylase 2 family uncharacterized protein YibQ
MIFMPTKNKNKPLTEKQQHALLKLMNEFPLKPKEYHYTAKRRDLAAPKKRRRLKRKVRLPRGGFAVINFAKFHKKPK